MRPSPRLSSDASHSNTFSPSFHSETWKWQPLPVRSANGLGMNVPTSHAAGPRLDHLVEEDRAVAGGQRVGELPVLFELAIGVLVIGGVGVPSEVLVTAGDCRHDVEIARERAQVVTGLARLSSGSASRRAVDRASQQDVLGFDTDIHFVALLGHAPVARRRIVRGQ